MDQATRSSWTTWNWTGGLLPSGRRPMDACSSMYSGGTLPSLSVMMRQRSHGALLNRFSTLGHSHACPCLSTGLAQMVHMWCHINHPWPAISQGNPCHTAGVILVTHLPGLRWPTALAAYLSLWEGLIWKTQFSPACIMSIIVSGKRTGRVFSNRKSLPFRFMDRPGKGWMRKCKALLVLRFRERTETRQRMCSALDARVQRAQDTRA